MTAAHDAPTSPGSGPSGPGGSSVGSGGSADHGGAIRSETPSDPIFGGEEPVERAPRRAALLFQFFLFPLMIVVFAVGVFLLFGAITGGTKGPDEALAEVTQGSENAQKQAAHQLAVLIVEERMRERKAKDEGKTDFVPFYRDGGFRDRLKSAFESSFPDKSPERKAFLAQAMGAVGDPAFAPVLAAHLSDSEEGDTDHIVRFSLAQALANLETTEAVPALSTLSKDPDTVVRNVAVEGLSRVKTAESTAALKAALSDSAKDVRLNAAAALALRGDAQGLAELEACLDPAAYRPASDGGLGLSADSRGAAIANAIRSVYALKVERLRPKVVLLTEDEDPAVRRLARDVLEKWTSAK